MWDIFISHASEDKEDIARPLAKALQQAGLTIWYDEFALLPGDSVSRSIKKGQNNSKFGLVILSPNFFANKRWAMRELDGFVAREIRDGKVIIPVWHKVTYDEVVQFSPDIADKLAIVTDCGVGHVVEQILRLFSDKNGNVIVKPRQPGDLWTDPPTGMEFAWIPDGYFQMGQTEADKRYLLQTFSEEDYKKYFARELPLHDVQLNGFWMGKYQVTQAQWQEMMGENPSWFDDERIGRDTSNHPVENISWDGIQKFLRKLNDKAGTEMYRLPSEAEWEYACRAGTRTIWSFGDNPEQLDKYAWYDKNSGGKTHPVGQLQPNAWGLYDMHGNVWEWCADPWHDNYQGAPKDGSVWNADGGSPSRVLRGGSWYNDPWYCRCAVRYWYNPVRRFHVNGFRVVRCSSRTH